jgi:hypothetical protein
VLKVDIEEWEWESIPDMLVSGALSDVRQFVTELHFTLGPLKPEPKLPKYLMGLQILTDLYAAGFRIFHTHKNMNCRFKPKMAGVTRTGCHEVSFVQINAISRQPVDSK